MKKTLNHIFDEANANEIENFVKQNAAPEVSADTLSSIKDKVYAKTNLKNERKPNKNIWFRFGAIAACFLLIVSAVIVVPMLREDDPGIITPPGGTSNDIDENPGPGTIGNPPPIDNNQQNGDVISGGENSMIPSIYPNAWQQMNVVIVKWKEQNEHTWSETYKQYDGKNVTIDYVGVEVEFVTVYSETMKESLIPNIESVIEQTTYLMIPKCYLDDIKFGDTALVFLEKIADVAIQDPNGNFEGMFTTVLGVRLGDNIAQGKYVPASIFNIVDDKLVINEKFYEVNPDNDEYYMIVMTHLHKANEYIRKNDSMKSIVFENGVNVVDLGAYFEFICGNK